ncbi:PP2C-like domain-containing protein CG9801 isoform X2 [Nematostella vectensis]|uniref:PP2C-like domain-containing protein CG9801 isoform X2 n=1 Tax=Nematostella vectensis TaxID=45351 RepID=UPI002076EBCD|nr:PP2C-like domain-containing protein CG9801 isoform X2 [Nematostella vectensis]
MAWMTAVKVQASDRSTSNIMDSTDSGIESDEDPVIFTQRLSIAYMEKMKQDNNVEWSKKIVDLPRERLSSLARAVSVATTGPGEGIQSMVFDPKHMESFKPAEVRTSKTCNALSEWRKRHDRACGIGISLYELDPLTNLCAGEPVADVFAVVARPNNCIISLADGVSWGTKSRLAARSAVAGSVQYLNQYLFTASNTHDVFNLLLKSFEFAQSCIIKNSATMTTLCTAVVAELEGTNQWGLCVLNVGDSLAFVYNKNNGVREITIGSHCEQRDMRCPGGSLGPVDGYNPDLENMTFSYTTVTTGDIVFLTSDGVSDNFDPVVSHCDHCQGPIKSAYSADSLIDLMNDTSILEKTSRVRRGTPITTRDTPMSSSYSPWDVPPVRLNKSLHDMTQVIEGEAPEDELSAQQLCAKLLSHVCKCTNEKRTFLQEVDRKAPSMSNGRRRPRDNEMFRRRVQQLPGKLDHASVVAFEVGAFPSEPLRLVSGGPETVRPPGLLLIDRIQNRFREMSMRNSNNYEVNKEGDEKYNELYSLLAPV